MRIGDYSSRISLRLSREGGDDLIDNLSIHDAYLGMFGGASN